MQRPSRSVTSPQTGPHRALGERLARHLSRPFRAPVAAHTATAFAEFLDWRSARDRPWVLDAGCGTGASAHFIAAADPAVDVLGVDKSAHRLGRSPQGGAPAPEDPDRVRLLRADLTDFWRLLLASGERPRRQYLLYPNPWPKPGHLHRRWHGHPVFPLLIAAGGMLELRSNWPVYVDEFALALDAVGVPASVDVFDVPPDGAPATPFERKYLASGQRCWRLRADLAGARVPGDCLPQGQPDVLPPGPV